YHLVKRLDRTYAKLTGRLRLYAFGPKDSIMGREVARYLEDMRERHEAMTDIMKILVYVSWPRTQQDLKAYTRLGEEVAVIRESWKNMPVVAFGAALAKRRQVVLSAWSAFEAAVDYVSRREGSRVLKGALQGMMVDFYAQEFEGSAAVTRFQAVLYAEALLQGLQKDSTWAKEVLVTIGLTPGSTRAMVQRSLQSFWGYVPVNLQSKVAAVESSVVALMGRDIQRREMLRTGLRAAKWTVMLASMLILGWGVLRPLSDPKLAVSARVEKVSREIAGTGNVQAPAEKKKIAGLFEELQAMRLPAPPGMLDVGREGVAKIDSSVWKAKVIALSQLEKKMAEVERSRQQVDVRQKEQERLLKPQEDALVAQANALKDDQPQGLNKLEEPRTWSTARSSLKEATTGNLLIEKTQALNVGQLPNFKISMGNGAIGVGEAIARSNQPYLAVSQFSMVDLNGGKLFAAPTNFKAWSDVTNGVFKDWVVLPNALGENVVEAMVAPGTVIDGVAPEKEGCSFKVYRDWQNGVWRVVFDKNPGKVKLSLKEQVEPVEALRLVDSHGQPVDKQAVMDRLQRKMMPELKRLLVRGRSLSVAEREEMVMQIRGLFNYSTNPAFDRMTSYSDALFTYFAGNCQGAVMLDIILRMMLDLPLSGVVQTGYSLENGMAFVGDGHMWMFDKEVRNPVEVFGGNYNLLNKKNVPESVWQGEMKFLGSPERMEKIRQAINGIGLKLAQQSLEARREGLREYVRQQSSSVKRAVTRVSHAEVLKYYQGVTRYYQGLLEGYDLDHMTADEKALLRKHMAGENFEQVNNTYQLMGYGHFLFRILSKIEAGALPAEREGVQALKNSLLARLRQKAIAAHWDLQEPTAGYLVTRYDYFRTDLMPDGKTPDGQVIYRDVLTGERLTVPVGAQLMAFRNGVYVFRFESGGVQYYFLRGAVQGLPVDDGDSHLKESFENSLWIEPSARRDVSSPDPLFVRKTNVGSSEEEYSLMGSLAHQAGVEGKSWKSTDMGYFSLDGELLLINRREGRFEGPLARRMGLDGIHFEKTTGPIKRPWGYMTFIREAGTSALISVDYNSWFGSVEIKRLTDWKDFIPEMFGAEDSYFKYQNKDGTWGWWGISEKLHVPSPDDLVDVRLAPGGHGKTMGDYSRNEIYCFKEHGTYRLGGQWVKEHGKVFNYDVYVSMGGVYLESRNLSQLKFSASPKIVFLSADGHKWVAQVQIIDEVGTYNPVTGISGKENMSRSHIIGSSKEVVEAFTKGLSISVINEGGFSGDLWMAPIVLDIYDVESGAGQKAYVGPLVDRYFPELSPKEVKRSFDNGLRLLSAVFGTDAQGHINMNLPVFVSYQDRKTKETTRRTIGHGRSPADDVVIKNLETGGGITVAMGGESFVQIPHSGIPGSTRTEESFVTRAIGMYGVTPDDGGGNIPEYRGDMRVKNLTARWDDVKSRGVADEEKALQWMTEYHALLEKMKNGSEIEYFDRDAFRLLVRHVSESSTLPLWNNTDYYENDLLPILHEWGFWPSLFEVLLTSDKEAGHDIQKTVTDYEWRKAVHGYFEDLRKSLGLPDAVLVPDGLMMPED
ncbi:MAG: hypothetical protein WCI27_08995, partial [Candidatus Omnitrophota bacterium]